MKTLALIVALGAAVLPGQVHAQGVGLRDRIVETCEGPICYLRCSGTQTLTGNLTLTGTLNVAGAVALSSSLTVTGAISTVTGTVTAANDLITGAGADLRLGRGIVCVNFTDDSATTGNRTVNKDCGINAFAAAATTITITNSRVLATTDAVFVELQTNDATARVANVVPAVGSFTINLAAAATATTKVQWWVVHH